MICHANNFLKLLTNVIKLLCIINLLIMHNYITILLPLILVAEVTLILVAEVPLILVAEVPLILVAEDLSYVRTHLF